MPSPSPQPSSSLADSERTASEAVAGEAASQTEQPIVESARTEGAMTVTVVEYPAMMIVGSSATSEAALVLVLASLPSASLAGQSDDRLADEVVHEFDATYHLSKLSVAWADLLAGAASFGELL